MLADIVDRVLREELIGERADRREWLWHRLWELDRTDEFPIWLIGLVDVALWDLEGRVLGVPVHRLLGTYREEIPACASTTTFATIEEFLEVADQCLELGYPAIKLHAWGDARADAELCQRLRDHVGPDVDLMYDGSAGSIFPTRCTSAALSLRRITGGRRSRSRSSASLRISGFPSAWTFRSSWVRRQTGATSTPRISSPPVAPRTSGRAPTTAAG